MSITTPSRKKTDADANNRLSLNERLALIGLINSEARNPHSPAPVVADLFDNLWPCLSWFWCCPLAAGQR